ncbi:MAG: DUF2179 domain-containing protein [Bacteroidales bacterium]|nr:DUF2179 domain-containing protein [Bacteroidales bacterium]MDZ4203724.1 DUF2179 domain-containing protein [Bacteroidales bacterium]
MDISAITVDSWIFTWVILPLLIIIARIADQTIGTLRLIFLSKGYKRLAPVLGFFEVIIWLLVVTQILRHLDNALTYIAYGLGFALGNYIGIVIEQKLSLGNVIIRIIPKVDTTDLLNYFREQNIGLTTVDAMGSRGPVKVIFSIIKRHDIERVVSIIHRFNPNSFYTIEDVKSVHEGIMSPGSRRSVFYSFWSGTKKSK